MRMFLVVIAVALLAPAGLSAEEIRGSVKSVDASKNRLTLMVGDKERTIMVAPQVRVSRLVTTQRIFPRRTSVQEYIVSLDQVREGSLVTVMTEMQSGSELATQVQLSQMSGTSSGGGRLRLFRR